MTGNVLTKTMMKWAIGLAAFAAAYLLINRYILAESVLYRAAAYDYQSAIINITALGVQAAILLLALLLLPRKYCIIVMVIALTSASANMIFGQILGETINLARTGWLMTETRQAGNAIGEFIAPLSAALLKIAFVGVLIFTARYVLRPMAVRYLPNWAQNPWLLIAALILPSVILANFKLGTPAAERNIYGYGIKILLAEPPPPRELVKLQPNMAGSPDKIIWIIDESISHDAYARLIAPKLTPDMPVDFGEAAALGNCSTPANVALRSGISVDSVSGDTDLRGNPSIWGYAQKAGYRTVMIDGQVEGPPQNQLLEPEQKLIDEYVAADSGMRTDLEIAKLLNTRLKSNAREFIYVVLRGVHFQYRDHYPDGTISDNAPLQQRYEAAITYSKQGFFKSLLNGIDRDNAAIIYTSDHGQHIADGVTPHCSLKPAKNEFSIPLAAFLPSAIAGGYNANSNENRSASQIFPATLGWMGYDRNAVIQKYDNDLDKATRQFIWFGRAVTPAGKGEKIEVTRSEKFPGL